MFSGYLDFGVFGETKTFKTHGVIIDITAQEKLLSLLIFQNPLQYQNKIWSDINAIYDKHFQLVFRFIVKTGNKFQVLL